MTKRKTIKLANWTREGIDEIKTSASEFVADMKDPVNAALFIIAVTIFVGLLMGSILG